MKNKKNVFLLAAIIIFLGIVLMFVLNNKETTKKEKLSIVTTLFPTYDFAKNIGGEKVEVSLLLPPGVEAHAFEPKPSDIVKINEADIFVYTGEFMEPWAHDIIEGANKNLKIVDASTGVELMKEEGEEHEHEHEAEASHEEAGHHEEEEHHHHGGVDPHIWLDFDNAKIMAENIAKALIKINPENTAYYQNNLESYQNKLTELDTTYKNTFSFCKSKTIVYGGHYAFGYMAKRYGLDYLSAQGFSPDSEPTAKEMIALTEQVKENNIGYIFYEELTSPKIAQTLANETKTKLLLLNGAHNLAKEDYEKNVSFVTVMKDNLVNLKVGLGCN